jgi:hypothetical protein
MTILDLLPLLEGWRYVPFDITAPVLCTAKKDIVTLDGVEGWLIWAAGIINNKNARLIVTYDNYYTADTTPFELYTGSLTRPSAVGFWLGTYDATDNIYALFFSPPYPWAFRKRLKLEVEPPPGESAVVSTYSHLVIHIDNKDAFLKSLRAIYR